MLRIGVTGSIAVGKSFVAGMLEELGCRVIDADQVARAVVEPGTIGLAKVVSEFGTEILKNDGSLNRERLGALVFGDQEKRDRLNKILHPMIIEAQDTLMRIFELEDPDAICVIDAALIIESGGYKRMDKLIVVHCDSVTQLQRLMNRNGLTIEESKERIAAQMSQEEKMRFADYLIDNSGTAEQTREQVRAVVANLRELLKRSKGANSRGIDNQ